MTEGHRYRTGISELDNTVVKLLKMCEKPCREDVFIREAITTILKMKLEEIPTLELKITNSALKEMRYAFKIFKEYRGIRKVTVFGSARAGESSGAYMAAREFGRKMAEKGYMVITGAGGGVMQAANEGAGRDMSFGLNVQLPFEQKPNHVVADDRKLINFKYFFTRKLFFLKEADALALFPGGYGTLNECMETLALIQTGKTPPVPVVMIDRDGYWKSYLEYLRENLIRPGFISPEDLNFFQVTEDIDEACSHIHNFYRNYHSIRVVGSQMVIRLNNRPDKEFIRGLNASFSDILDQGEFILRGCLEEEADEEEIIDLPRLVFNFDGRSFGRFRKLIDAINDGAL